MLSYTAEVTTHRVEKKEVVIKVDSDWEMNSPQSNQTMKRKAQSLLNNIEKVKEKGAKYSDYIKVFEKYFKAYKKACQSSATKEASSPAVSKLVFDFAVKVGKAVDVKEDTLVKLFKV